MTHTSNIRQQAMQAWLKAGQHKDLSLLLESLADDVCLVSPLTDAFSFNGKQQIADLMTVVSEHIDGLQLITQVYQDDWVLVRTKGFIGQQQFEETQYLLFNEAGLIQHITLFLRPLPALTMFMHCLGPSLTALQNKPYQARAVGVSSWLMNHMAQVGETKVMPKVDPNRSEMYQQVKQGE